MTFRIAIARLWHEGNSFTPVLTRLADFQQREWAEGISVPAPLPCRSLLVRGDGSPETRGPSIAALYGSDEMSFAGLDHFELVLDERVPRAIARYAGFDVAGEAASS